MTALRFRLFFLVTIFLSVSALACFETEPADPNAVKPQAPDFDLP